MNDLIQEHLSNFFYLDIETIPEGEPLTRDDLVDKVPKSYKKQESIDKWIEDKIEEEYRGRSLHSLKGRLVSVAIALNEMADSFETIKVVKYKAEEKEMIDELALWIKEISNGRYATYGWVGKNIKEFDMLWLMHRFLKYGHTGILHILPRHGKDKRIIDLQDLFAFTAYKKYYSMEDICTYLGMDVKRDGMDGSKVFDLFEKPDLDKIYKYNAEDVYDNRQLHNKLRGV